ncbi:MAG: hypothetical protein ABH826_00620 [Patescibacteria group bacterium]|nr:hypothetical protein [Patescibacteria group bacterium]
MARIFVEGDVVHTKRAFCGRGKREIEEVTVDMEMVKADGSPAGFREEHEHTVCGGCHTDCNKFWVYKPGELVVQKAR